MVGSSQRGECGDCGKTYRVPDPTRRYTCKACGGRVTTPESPPPPPRPARRRVDDPRRKRAAGELQRVHRNVSLLRVLLIIPTGWVAIAMVVVALFPDEDEARGAHLAMVAGLAAGVSLGIAGIIHIRHRPFFWTLLLAIVATGLALVFMAVERRVHLGSVVVVLFLWTSVIPTARARRWLREYPDLYVSHKLRGTLDERPRGFQEGAQRTLSAEVHAEANRRAWLWTGIAVAGVLVVAGGLLLFAPHVAKLTQEEEGPPPVPAPPRCAEDFRRAWAAGDAAAVATLFGPLRRDEREAWLRAAARRRGWGTRWPAIVRTEQEDERGLSRITFQTARDRIETTWMDRGWDWWINTMDLPLLPRDDVRAEFTAAWHAGDIPRLAALFVAGGEERHRAALEHMRDAYGWSEAFPRLGTPTEERMDGSAVRVTFPSGAHRLEISLRQTDDDEWRTFRVRWIE